LTFFGSALTAQDAEDAGDGKEDKSLTAEDEEDAKESNSLTAKDAEDAKEGKSLTAEDAEDAKGTNINQNPKNAKVTPRVAYRRAGGLGRLR